MPEPVNCVVYEIVNLVTGQQYIGSTFKPINRWKIHRYNLNLGQHYSKQLQRDWKEFGEASFEIRVLEHVADQDKLLEREQYYLDTLQPEYNSNPTAGSSLGATITEEHRAKIAAKLRGNTNSAGRVMTPEQNAKMQAGRNKALAEGRIHVAECTPELREKRRQITTARHANTEHTPEWQEKVKQAGQKAAATRMAKNGPSARSIQNAQAVKRYSPEWVEKVKAAKLAKAAERTEEERAAAKARRQDLMAKGLATMAAKREAGYVYERTPEMRENYRKSRYEYIAKTEQPAEETNA